MKDKQPKLQFLEKLVNFLETKFDMTINEKPDKIISGLEPEKKRYLLHLFNVVATDTWNKSSVICTSMEALVYHDANW